MTTCARRWQRREAARPKRMDLHPRHDQAGSGDGASARFSRLIDARGNDGGGGGEPVVAVGVKS
jgi:hypothetical protein